MIDMHEQDCLDESMHGKTLNDVWEAMCHEDGPTHTNSAIMDEFFKRHGHARFASPDTLVLCDVEKFKAVLQEMALSVFGPDATPLLRDELDEFVPKLLQAAMPGIEVRPTVSKSATVQEADDD